VVNPLPSLLAEAHSNKTIREIYAKRNCRSCLGRGIESIRLPGASDVQGRLCNCVIKAIKSETKKHGQDSKKYEQKRQEETQKA
jgi:hypothetical protein